MRTKLTLSVDQELSGRAKESARALGKSLSEMVEDFFSVLTSGRTQRRRGQLTPAVRALRGCLAGATVDARDHQAELEKKYR